MNNKTNNKLNENKMKISKKLLKEYIQHKAMKFLNEQNFSGVNYDATLSSSSELIDKVGNLNKLAPYVLEIGDKVEEDSSGKIHVTDTENGKKKIFKNIDDFLSGIKYKKQSIKENEQAPSDNGDNIEQRKPRKFRTVKVYFEDGDYFTTDMNGNLTDKEIKDYYRIGRTFNVGSGPNDNMQKVSKIEIIN